MASSSALVAVTFSPEDHSGRSQVTPFGSLAGHRSPSVPSPATPAADLVEVAVLTYSRRVKWALPLFSHRRMSSSCGENYFWPMSHLGGARESLLLLSGVFRQHIVCNSCSPRRWGWTRKVIQIQSPNYNRSSISRSLTITSRP